MNRKKVIAALASVAALASLAACGGVKNGGAATGTTLTEGIRHSDPASGKTWSLGDSMMITIVRADINLGKVDFEVAPETK